MNPGWAKPSIQAKYAGVERRTIYSWLKDGLPHSRLPSGRILIRFEDVDLYLKRFQVADRKAAVGAIVEDVMRGMQ